MSKIFFANERPYEALQTGGPKAVKNPRLSRRLKKRRKPADRALLRDEKKLGESGLDEQTRMGKYLFGEYSSQSPIASRNQSALSANTRVPYGQPNCMGGLQSGTRRGICVTAGETAHFPNPRSRRLSRCELETRRRTCVQIPAVDKPLMRRQNRVLDTAADLTLCRRPLKMP